MTAIKRFFLQTGKFVLLNTQQKRFRRGVIFMLTNLLMLSGIIFAAEVVVVFLGVGDVSLPLTRSAQDFLSRIFF